MQEQPPPPPFDLSPNSSLHRSVPRKPKSVGSPSARLSESNHSGNTGSDESQTALAHDPDVDGIRPMRGGRPSLRNLRKSHITKEALPAKLETKHLMTMEFNCSLASFWGALWQDNAFASFFLESLKDEDIAVSDWERAPEEVFDLERLVTSNHPMGAVKFPGVDSHAASYKRQRVALLASEDRSTVSLILVENITMVGSLPYSTFFTIQITWQITEHWVQPPSSAGGNEAHPTVRADLGLAVIFSKKVFV